MPLNAVKRCDKNGTISEIKLPDMLLAEALTLGMFAVVKPPTKNECKPSAQSSRVQKIGQTANAGNFPREPDAA